MFAKLCALSEKSAEKKDQKRLVAIFQPVHPYYIYWKEEGTQRKTLRYTNGNLILEEFDKDKLRFILQRYIKNTIID